MLALLTDLQLFLATGFAGMRMSATAPFFLRLVPMWLWTSIAPGSAVRAFLCCYI